MRAAVAIVLIVVGAFVILGPVVAHTYTDNRDKERVAEFYSRTGAIIGTGYAPLPPDLRPTGKTKVSGTVVVTGPVQRQDKNRPTSGSSRPGQAAGFRRAKVFGFVDRPSWFTPLVRAA